MIATDTKYVIVLPDGASDEPLAEFGGRTPLQAADIPNMDWVARHGRLGRVVTVPPGYTPGTDVATLSLFGYDPDASYSGRAPIEAAARGLTVGPDQIVYRCNFVTITDGRMRDFTAHHISQPEANRLIADLNRLFADEPCVFYSGVSYRNLMIASGIGDTRLQCAPPHDIPNQPVAEHLPHGTGQEKVREIMARAAELLRDHEVNRARRDEGRPPVSDIWLWGQGRPTQLEPFAERFGPRGVVITGVDILRGLAVMMGMKLIEVPGATGYIDTNYAGKGAAAVGALDDYDLVAVHIEAPDEAGHLGDAREKIKALEHIDALIVAPLLEALRRHAKWKMLIAPDHPTPCTTTAHDATPPPFCFAGTDVEAVERRPFSEKEAVAGGWLVDPGHRLMELFIPS
jgi:2,3-bisphosphoglycerate-independent phosphoglycerate mutase